MHAADDRERRRHLAEEDQAHEDRQRRHDVGRDAELPGGHAAERVAPGREGERGRHDAEVQRCRARLPRARPRAREASWPANGRQAISADDASDEGDLAGRQAPGHRLLREHADRVGDRGREAPEHPDRVDRAPARPTTRLVPMPISSTPRNATPAPIASQRGMPSPRKSPAPSAIRIGPMLTIIAVVPGVEGVLGEVERHVVGAEPADAVDDEPHPVAAGRPHPAALHGTRMPSATAPTSEPTQREGAAADVRSDAADDDERARPGEHGERDRRRAAGRACAWRTVTGALRVRSRVHARPGRRTRRQRETDTAPLRLPPQCSGSCESRQASSRCDRLVVERRGR